MIILVFSGQYGKFVLTKLQKRQYKPWAKWIPCLVFVALGLRISFNTRVGYYGVSRCMQLNNKHPETKI